MDKYAYVTVLYGNNIYLTGALVLGFTLMKTKTKHDRVILVTSDVSMEYRNILSIVYNRVVEIDYVDVSSEIFSDENTRFRDVFTKLRSFQLIEYDKIILLDLDMIIVKNIDHLFQLKTPAACLKHYYVPYGHLIPPKMICQNNKLVGSINAGLMLLKPDLEEWNNIQTDIKKSNQINQYRYPEQDYLSLRYCCCWTSITFNYNFQFGLTKRVKKCHYKANDIYVIHYSSSYKPWNRLLIDYSISDDEKKFTKQHKKYDRLWHNTYRFIKKYYLKKDIVLPF